MSENQQQTAEVAPQEVAGQPEENVQTIYLEKGDSGETTVKVNQHFSSLVKENTRDSEAVNRLKNSLQRYIPGKDYVWPEDRRLTEDQILQLKDQQILLIRGIESPWLNRAPVRIAAVLQAASSRLWPECVGVYRLGQDENLPFLFWKNMGKFPHPMIIVVPASLATAYLRNFVLAGGDKAYYEFKRALKEVNIFLALQLHEDNPLMEDLRRIEDRHELQAICASWRIPVIRLELRSWNRPNADDLYDRIKGACEVPAEDEGRVYDLLLKQRDTGEQELLEIIRRVVKEKSDESLLLDRVCRDESELKLRLIYCATFFYEMNQADFRRIASCLLEGRVTRTRSANGLVYEKRLLNSIWRNPLWLQRVLADCKIVTKEVGEIPCVKFDWDIRAERVRKLLLEKDFLFYLLTGELIDRNILFGAPLSAQLLPVLAGVIMLAISKNYTTYNGKWLVEKVTREGARSEGVKYLLKELLLSRENVLMEIVKVFFQSMIENEGNVKKVLEMAVELCRDLREVGNFPEEDLDEYFRWVLEQRKPASKFDAYWLMVRSHDDKKALYRKTAMWLEECKGTKNPWTRRFSHLYRLDYFAISFYNYFQVADGEKEYALLAWTDEGRFSPELGDTIEELTSDAVTASWKELTEQYEDLFWNQCYQLEKPVTGVDWIQGRGIQAYQDVLTLAGDIIETWFYILACEEKELVKKEQMSERMKTFRTLVRRRVKEERLRVLEPYWLGKAKNLYPATIKKYENDEKRSVKERDDVREVLDLRTGCLLLLAANEKELNRAK